MAGKNNDTNMPMVHCSFCGKTEKQVHKLIAGPNGVYICDECIDLCDEILAEEFQDDFDTPESVPMTLRKLSLHTSQSGLSVQARLLLTTKLKKFAAVSENCLRTFMTLKLQRL